MSLAHELYPHIDTALRRVRRLHRITCKCLGLEDFISTLPLPAILLDWELAPLYYNRAGCRAAALWNGSDPLLKLSIREFKVPKDLLSVVEEIRIRQTLVSSNSTERVVLHPSLPRLKAHVSVRRLRSLNCRTAVFVIRFETEASQEPNLARFARLSPKECELALMVNEGKSNQEIADTLGRQLNTVKSELHSVFKKLGIPSRARLMAMLR